MDESTSTDELFVAGKVPSGNDERCISRDSVRRLPLSQKNIWHSAHVITRRAAFYSKIDEYFKEGTYTDVNIVCDGGTFRCHRLALAAASEYFHSIFEESDAQDINLSAFVHRTTFEQILIYVYRGEVVAMNDRNVFKLLLASNTFALSDIEDHCVHYLTQKNIPIHCALLLHSYALDFHKVSLIPAVCKFILEHLDCFRQESKFLEMSFDDFGTLLEYFQPSSASRETRLLDVIFEWVCRKSGVREERWSYFTELADKVQFRTFSALCVAKYFERNSDDSNERRQRIVAPDLYSERLHVYIGTIDRKTTSYNKKDPSTRQLSVFSLQENGSESIDWHLSHTIRPSFQKMRTVESDGHLYSLKLSKHRWTFSSSIAINLSSGMQPLALPSGVLLMNPSVFTECNYGRSNQKLFALCPLHRKIYLSGLHENVGLQCYDTELDVWSRIPVLSKHNEPKNIISDDIRLYMIDERPSCNSFHFSTFDPREGKVKKLCNEGLRYLKWCDEPCSYLKGKIYLPEYDVGCSPSISTLKMAIYDPILGRWEVQNSRFQNEQRYTHGRRIVPFNDRLWMFGLQDGFVYTKTYDSYLQRWSNVYVDGLYSLLSNLKLYSTDFLDAVPSKYF